MSFVGGIHGFATARFTWGVSGSLGAHEADLFITDTVNASLGPDTPTSFKLGGHRQREVALHANSRSQESIGDGDTWRVLERRRSSRMKYPRRGVAGADAPAFVERRNCRPRSCANWKCRRG